MPDAADFGIEIVREPIALAHLHELVEGLFGDLVKAVVDVERGIVAIGGELHADEEAVLLDDGSRQVDLWGINLYPADHGDAGFVEFDSMINVRPGQGNRSRSVEDEAIRARIFDIVAQFDQAMTLTLHRGLAAGRWQKLTLLEQLANVGSEFGRAARAKEAGNDARFESALGRCLELFDLTLADERWHGRRREIARAREVVVDFLGSTDTSAREADALDAYFLTFARAARARPSLPRET